MFKGIFFALAACFVWGFIFIIPQFMAGFSSFEVVLGRYFFYSLISCLIFVKEGFPRYPFRIWMKAFVFSFASTIFYYMCLVMALRYCDAAICALVLSISPITIAFYGNWMESEGDFRRLILPSILILLGLVIINVPHFHAANSVSDYSLGLLCSSFSLLTWSWYVVANSRFLKRNPEMKSTNWSTLVGVVTVFWVLLWALFSFLFFSDQIQWDKYKSFDTELLHFVGGAMFLGFICSWLGAYLWNRASFYLPVSLAGQLTIFETIFGLVFVYLLAQNLPSSSECFGIVLLLGAVVYGIRQSAQTSPQHA